MTAWGSACLDAFKPRTVTNSSRKWFGVSAVKTSTQILFLFSAWIFVALLARAYYVHIMRLRLWICARDAERCARGDWYVYILFCVLMHYGARRWAARYDPLPCGRFRAGYTQAFSISIASPFQIGPSKARLHLLFSAWYWSRITHAYQYICMAHEETLWLWYVYIYIQYIYIYILDVHIYHGAIPFISF